MPFDDTGEFPQGPSYSPRPIEPKIHLIAWTVASIAACAIPPCFGISPYAGTPVVLGTMVYSTFHFLDRRYKKYLEFENDVERTRNHTRFSFRMAASAVVVTAAFLYSHDKLPFSSHEKLNAEKPKDCIVSARSSTPNLSPCLK